MLSEIKFKLLVKKRVLLNHFVKWISIFCFESKINSLLLFTSLIVVNYLITCQISQSKKASGWTPLRGFAALLLPDWDLFFTSPKHFNFALPCLLSPGSQSSQSWIVVKNPDPHIYPNRLIHCFWLCPLPFPTEIYDWLSYCIHYYSLFVLVLVSFVVGTFLSTTIDSYSCFLFILMVSTDTLIQVKLSLYVFLFYIIFLIFNLFNSYILLTCITLFAAIILPLLWFLVRQHLLLLYLDNYTCLLLRIGTIQM